MTALVGGSVLLIVGSAIALVFGWGTANSSLIWTSIAASVAAAVLLALGYQRAKVEARAPRPRPPAPTRGPTREEAAEAVVAVPDRKRFHRPSCRYAGMRGAQEMSRDAALRRGYDPCNICKP